MRCCGIGKMVVVNVRDCLSIGRVGVVILEICSFGCRWCKLLVDIVIFLKLYLV